MSSMQGENKALLFADVVVLLAPSEETFQRAHEHFIAESEVAGMKISTSKCEAMAFS